MTSVLVLGGARSGKSRYAERLLSGHTQVRYLAPGPVPDGSDPDWSARVAEHRARRSPAWQTVETGDVAGVLEQAPASTAVLVDCLGTWLTRRLDELDGWARPSHAAAGLDRDEQRLVAAVQGSCADVVLVSNEVGAGVVPASAAGRLFRDRLGRLNARMADCCDRLVLVVAGRVVELTGAVPVSSAPPLAEPGRSP